MDATPTTAVTVTVDPKVAALVADLPANVDLIKTIVAAIKSRDMNAAAQQLPKAIAVVQDDIADVTAAIPVIKSGWRTSEFWLGAGSVLALTITPIFTHEPPSAAVVTVVGAVAAVYTVVRGLVKSATAK